MREVASRRTPYNDSYPTCERTCAELLIYPGAMDPVLVSKRLELEPTLLQRAGDRSRNSLGRERVTAVNGWFLSSEGRSSSMDLRRHLDWLLERLVPKRNAVLALQQIEGLKMGVNCIWWSAQGQGGPTLWPEQMRSLADLDLECSFDVSCYGDDD